MRQSITADQAKQLRELQRRGRVLVRKLSEIEDAAAELLNVGDDPDELTARDQLVDCVWNGTTIERTLELLDVEVRA